MVISSKIDRVSVSLKQSLFEFSSNSFVDSYLNIYRHYFGANAYNVAEIVNIITNLFVRLTDCSSIVNFAYAIISFLKDMQGITYLDFQIKYEKFVLCAIGSIFAIKLFNRDNKISVAQDSTSEARNFIGNLREVLHNYSKVRYSDFGTKLCNFCAIIICSPLCVKAGIDSTWFGFSDIFHKRLMKEKREKEHFDLVFEILDTSSYLMEKIILFLQSGNFHFLYVDDNEILEYEQSFEKLSHYSDKFALLANQGMTVRDYLNECDLTIERGKRLKDFYSNDKFKVAALKSQQASLGKFKLRAFDKLQVSSKRSAPLAFCLLGPPNIGKSDLTDKILYSLYLNDIDLGITGKKYDKDVMKYIYNEDDEFMSEFKASHEVCVMDDVDQFQDKINEAKEGGSIAKSIYFVNPVPYITNQAALEDKGMIPFLCRYVVMTTNTYDAGISKVFRPEGGAYRRFLFIEVQVKEQYRRPGQTSLQGDLSENGYMNHEIHDFWVRKYLTRGQSSEPVYWDPDMNAWSQGGPGYKRAMSFAELIRFYRYEIQEPHYRQDDHANKSAQHFMSSELCDKCKVPTCLCECCTSKAQSADILGFNFYDQNPISVSIWDNFNCFVTLFLLGFWYILHKMLSLLFGHNKPNFATYNVVANIERLPSSYNVPYVYKIMPNYVRARLICDDWILFVQKCAKRYKNCGVLTYHNFFQAQKGYNRYHIAGLVGLLGSLLYFYNNYKTIVVSEGQDDGKPYVDETQPPKKDVWSVAFQPISKLSGPTSTITMNQLVHNAIQNVCRLVVNEKSTNMFFVTSTIAVLPKHFYEGIREVLPCEVEVLFDEVGKNISLNRKLVISHNNFMENGLTDVIFFQHNSIVPRRDLSKFFLDKPLDGKCKGIILPKNKDGSLRPVPIDGFHKEPVHYYWHNKYIVLRDCGYVSWTNSETKAGDCGAPYIINTPNGCFIGGIHIAGRDEPSMGMYRAECHMILRHDLNVESKMFVPISRNGLDLHDTYCSDKDLSISQSVHDKDPIKEVTGSACIYGTLNNYPRRKMKSKVDHTLISEDVLDYYGLDNYTHFSPKDISSRQATILNVAPMLDKPTFLQDDVNRSEKSLFNWFLREIGECKIPFPKGPYDIDVGINGYDGALYIDRLPTKTSVGFPHGGAKIKHLIDVDPVKGHAIRRHFDQVLQCEYDKILEKYKNGERACIVFDSNFKDEPVSQSKIDKNKCRIFNAGPCAFTVLFRQYFLWCIPYFSGKHRHKFGMAIGANAYSSDWKVLFDHVTKHGEDRIIAGDYSNFDKRMSAQIMTAAFNVLYKLCQHFGWSDEDLLIMRGLASDVCYPLTNVFGLLMETDGSNPSGHPLTTVINGMCNIIYMMLACMDIERCEKKKKINYDYFLNYFSLLTYGDDNFGSVSKSIKYVDHTKIANALAKYGVIYTMSDKNSESRPFIHYSEGDFLKRKFVKDSHFKGHVGAPLSEESIIKMLSVIVVSDSITLEEQTAAVIESASREYFQYGKEVYEKRMEFLSELLDRYKLRPYLSTKLYTWEERMVELRADYGLSEAQSYDYDLKISRTYAQWAEEVDAFSNFSDNSLDFDCAFVEADRLVRLTEKRFEILDVPADHFHKLQMCLVELILMYHMDPVASELTDDSDCAMWYSDDEGNVHVY